MMSRISQLGAHLSAQLGNRVRLLSALTAAVLLWAAPHAAQAAGYVYQKHTVNAGVVFAGSASDAVGGSDPAPYLFYVLNNRPDARPADLTLVNPQAPATVTPALNRRWSYALGTAVTPSMAGYWEVPLHDVSSEELQQYDVLYLPANGYRFSPADNEKLRRFVDSGGQLFVEYNAASGTPGLFSGVTLATGASATLSLPPTSATTFLRHPLLSQPYLLSPTEVSSLGDTTVTANLSGIVGSDYVNLFGPVLVHPNGSAVIAGQLGGGQVIASVQNIGQVIGGGNGANYLATGLPPTPSDFAAVPAADLKFLSNLVSWAETHPSEYRTSHGNASTSGLAAFSTSWLYPVSTKVTAANTPPAAAVWGNFVYAVDAGGTLQAFNAYPGSNLTGPAGGTEPTTTYPTKAYDQVWQQTVGVNASAPTVAAYNGVTYVFIEQANGIPVSFNAVTGGPGLVLQSNPLPVHGTYPVNGAINAPSPTYYDGRLYVGQADGTLSIYDLNEITASGPANANIPLNPSTSVPVPTESVVGPPSVGLLANGDTNIIVAVVPTTQNIYTVLAGARNEPLKQYATGGVLAGYSIDRAGRYILPNLVADTSAVPALVPYFSNGVLYTGAGNTAQATIPQDPLFPITEYNNYFTDWDTAFEQTTENNLVANLNFISANTLLGLNVAAGPGAPSSQFSAPAIDRRGDYYYTLNANLSNGPFSYLIGVKNAPISSNVQLKFRFRLPTQAESGLVDADGVVYSSLAGYKFVGAPVVDDQGNVYAVATGGGKATVLCFKGNQQVTADAPAGIDLASQASIQQNDEVTGQANTISPGNTFSNANGTTTVNGQYTPGTNQIAFYNFGARAGSPIQQIAGNLTEPQPVQAVSNGTVAFATTALPLHTNLAWYVNPFSATGIIGLTKVGSTLFLTDGAILYSLPAAPKIGPNKLVQSAPSQTPLGLGAVAAPPSVGGGVLIVNGALGIGALTRQVTVVADNHRVLGVDGNGAAVWAVDATTRTTPSGVTKVPFSHPVSLSQFADNEFLVADTGNNRCVRFDSGGNVQWELTRFIDPSGLMGPGQPDTLSQPTSVQPHTLPDPDTTNNPNGTLSSYLIADSGNDRIVEVTDKVDSKGNVFPTYTHVLTWVTHTGDISGRRYRYGSATYYPSPAGLSVAATVTNTRIGKLAANGALGPASGDAPGGCLVVFSRPATPVAFSSGPPNDLQYITPGFYTESSAATPTYTPYTVKNPRFLQLYANTATGAVSPVTGVAPFSFLYADDNGAFDLTYDNTRKAFIAGNTSLQFTQGDYQGMTTPINAQGVTAGQTFARTGFPFVPSCIQRFDADGSGISHYLITQTYAQGEVGGRPGSNYGVAATYVPPGFGGEAFEVYYDGTTGSPTYQKFVGSGTYAGHTLSRPDLTGPLTQPNFALRLP